MVRGSRRRAGRDVVDRRAAVAAEGLLAAREGGIGVLAGGRLTVEDAYAYAKFARVAAGTNDVDFRARPHSAEELDFLAAHVVGQGPETPDYTRLEAAPAVLCVALEPEEEAPIVFLRLRKAVRKHGQKVYHLGQWTTPAVERTSPSPGSAAPAAKDNLIPRRARRRGRGARRPGRRSPPVVGPTGGGVILVGERAAEVPGLYSALSRGSPRAPARSSAGCRGGRGSAARSRPAPLPTLLPGGRPVADAAARAEVEQAWGLADGALPATPGRDTDAILAAAAAGRAGGARGRRASTRTTWPTRPRRWPALREVGFLVSLEMLRSAGHRARRRRAPGRAGRRSAPAATSTGRAAAARSAPRSTPAACCPTAGCSTRWPSRWTSTCSPRPRPPRRASWPGSAGTSASRPPAPTVDAGRAAAARRSGQAVLATWRQLLDESSLAVDEPHLAGTARPAQRAGATRPRPQRLGLTGGRAGDGAHRARHDHAAGGDRRPAGRRRVAAGELPGLAGAGARSASGTATWWGCRRESRAARPGAGPGPGRA